MSNRVAASIRASRTESFFHQAEFSSLQLLVPLGQAQWKPNTMNHSSATLVSFCISTPGASASILRTVFLFDFRWACPSGITTGRLQGTPRIGPLSIGLDPMEAATDQLIRRHSPPNPVINSEHSEPDQKHSKEFGHRLTLIHTDKAEEIPRNTVETRLCQSFPLLNCSV